MEINQTIKTLVFEYTKLRKGKYLVTLREDENPKNFISHPAQFTFTSNPTSHFAKHSKLMPIIKRCKSI